MEQDSLVLTCDEGEFDETMEPTIEKLEPLAIPTKKEDNGASTSRSTEDVLLKKIEKLEAMVADLQQGKVPFYDENIFMKKDIKAAAIYISMDVAPVVKKLLYKSKLSNVYFKLNERTYRASPKPCTNWNQGRYCNTKNGDFRDCHMDQRHGLRIRACSLCWEVLGSFHLHPVKVCPLVNAKIWAELEIDVNNM